MKLRGESITVTEKKGWPVSFRSRGRTVRVLDMIDVWVVQGRWWEREERRVYFRVRTDRGTCELYRRRDRWVLAREFD